MKKEKALVSLYRRVYSSDRLVFCLRLFGAVAVAYVALVFLATLLTLFVEESYAEGVKLALLAAVPFVFVSVLRALINLPRPCEVIDDEALDSLRKDGKKGKSFPSRHVFSAFLIGVLILPYSIPLGVIGVIIGAYLAFARVALGIHFVEDVVAGAVIGTVSGLLGILIL